MCGCNSDTYCQQIANQNYDYCDADNKCKKIIWSFGFIGGSSGWAEYENTSEPPVKFVSDGSKVFGVTQGQESNYYIVNNLIQLSPNANNTFSVLQKPLSSGQSNTTLSNIPGVMAYDGKVNIVTEFNYLSSNRHNVSVIDITGAKASSLLEFKPAYGLLSVVSGKFNADNSFDFVGIKAPAVSTNPPIFLAFYKNTGSTSTAAFNEPVQLTLQNATGIGYDKIRDIVSGDFNNDGKTDILTIYRPQAGQCEIYVWENQGDNTLKAVKWKASHSFPSTYITGRVVVGDFNGDGKLDLAAVENINNADEQIAIHVWTNTGAATFSDPSVWFSSTGGYKTSKIKGVVSGKFYNSDNKSEIVILYQYTYPSKIRAHVFAPSTSEQ